MTLIEDDHVVETLATDRANDALNIGVLPGRSWRGDDLCNAHRLDAVAEVLTIRCIPIPHQIAGCGVPRKGLGHLACKPVLRGVFGDLEVNDPSTVMTEDDEGIEKPKSRGYNNEQYRWRPGNACGYAEMSARSGRGLWDATACICRPWLG
jgi:hypothetical protein